MTIQDMERIKKKILVFLSAYFDAREEKRRGLRCKCLCSCEKGGVFGEEAEHIFIIYKSMKVLSLFSYVIIRVVLFEECFDNQSKHLAYEPVPVVKSTAFTFTPPCASL